MAITIPDHCWRQKSENVSQDENDVKSFAYILKGPYSELEDLGNAIKKGTEIVSGWIANTWTLQRVPGDGATLTINCKPNDMTGEPEEEGGDDPTQVPLKDIWQIKSVRNDVSILGYCGDANNNPHRTAIELWQKETDPIALRDNAYHKLDGTMEALTSAELALVQKIKKGIDSVVRFYPVVTRTRVYSTEPKAFLENVGVVDTPPAPAGGGLAAKIALYEWLKMQDDSAEQSNGDWNRVESWWGILKSDAPQGGHPWDPDLYGPQRWTMPYQH